MGLLSKKTGDVTVVYVQNDVDQGYKDHMFRQKMEEVIQEGGYRIVVNLALLDHIGSGAIAALIWAKKRTREQGGDVLLAEMLSPVRELFELMRLHLVFDIFETEKEAIAHFARSNR